MNRRKAACQREVVGQMMDYAANAILHWPVEELRERFAMRCEKAGLNPAEHLLEQLGPDEDVDAFWGKVKANLLAGRIRMLFVADIIPPELRKIVEFLNVQLRPAEVLAIELRQYQGEGLRTLAPIVVGQTQEAMEQTGVAGSKPRRQWDEAQFRSRSRRTVIPDTLKKSSSGRGGVCSRLLRIGVE
jgi:hypothetical protein